MMSMPLAEQGSSAVRSLCELWAKRTVGEWMAKTVDGEMIGERLVAELKMMRKDGTDLGSKRATGEVVAGLVRMKETEVFAAPFPFSEVFRELSESGELDPGSYLMDISARLSEADETLSRQFTAAFLARGFRAFPSFLRETDFAVVLGEVLREADKRAKVVAGGLADDVVGHADLFLSFRGQRYRLWHYLSTDRALSSLMQKLKGEARGNLKRGLHVFCPVDLRSPEDCESVCGWRLCSRNYAETTRNLLARGSVVSYARMLQDLNRPSLFGEPFVMRKGWLG